MSTQLMSGAASTASAASAAPSHGPSSASVQQLLDEVSGGAALSTHLAANTRHAKIAHTIFMAILIIVIVAGVGVAIYLAVSGIKHIDPVKGGNNKLPVYTPPSGPVIGGIPKTGPGSGKGCYASIHSPSFMPDGCAKETDPNGYRWQWGKLDISGEDDQPTYSEEKDCGGSCGTASLGFTETVNPVSQILICPPGPLTDSSGSMLTPATAPYKLSNPYPHPVSVQSLAFGNSTATSGSFNGVNASNAADGGWACYWSTQFDGSTGQLMPGSQPALVPPGVTVPLSYGFDSGKEVQDTKGENAALAFIIPQCTNHGPFWKQISGAYPPCQDTSPLAKALNWVEGAADTAWNWASPKLEGAWDDAKKEAGKLGKQLEGAAKNDWSNIKGAVAKYSNVTADLDGLSDDIQHAAAGQTLAATPQPMRLNVWDDIKDGVEDAVGWLAKETCICGDPLLPANPGCIHYWNSGATIAPSTAPYFAFTQESLNADPIPQPSTATAAEFPTNQAILEATGIVTQQLENETVGNFVKAQNANGAKMIVQPLFYPLGPQSPFKRSVWSNNNWVPQLGMCSEGGLTK